MRITAFAGRPIFIHIRYKSQCLKCTLCPCSVATYSANTLVALINFAAPLLLLCGYFRLRKTWLQRSTSLLDKAPHPWFLPLLMNLKSTHCKSLLLVHVQGNAVSRNWIGAPCHASPDCTLPNPTAFREEIGLQVPHKYIFKELIRIWVMIHLLTARFCQTIQICKSGTIIKCKVKLTDLRRMFTVGRICPGFLIVTMCVTLSSTVSDDSAPNDFAHISNRRNVHHAMVCVSGLLHAHSRCIRRVDMQALWPSLQS